MELVIFTGLQGADKTSFYRRHFAATHVHVSLDLLRNLRGRRTRQKMLLAQALSLGRPIVVDNTNPRAQDRAPLIEIARYFGARVVGYYLEATVAECLARNARREGRARVPAVAIYATAKKLEPPTHAKASTRSPASASQPTRSRSNPTGLRIEPICPLSRLAPSGSL